jgi:hypothetical protein
MAAAHMLHIMPQNLLVEEAARLSLDDISRPNEDLAPGFTVCEIDDCHQVLHDRPAVGSHHL